MKPSSVEGGPGHPAGQRKNIVIATDTRSDESMIRKLLGTDLGEVAVSTSAENAATDFDEHQPRVLLLAFDSLVKAQQYCLGLYRFSARTHEIPHRTLVLCTKDEAPQAYALCEKEFFDDYVLFWPLAQDGSRLRMSVLLALRFLQAAERSVFASRLASQARRIAALEATLASAGADMDTRLRDLAASTEAYGHHVSDTVDSLAEKVALGEFDSAIHVHDHEALSAQLSRFRDEQANHLQETPRAVTASLRAWYSAVGESLRPHLEAVRHLGALADRVRPYILVVDDDELQCKLLTAQLRDERYELVCVGSAEAALRTLPRRLPDLILLDVELPDTSGPDLLRRLRRSEAARAVPVIVISGHNARPVVLDAIEAGAVGFIVKPIDRELLLQRIAAALG